MTDDARSLLSELDHEGRRDYDTLVEKLANRFGSVNRSEIYRTQLKSRTRHKGESIPELAQSIKKLVRQAYPGVNKDVIETLAIDNFIDALTDSDLRLRVRELGPKTVGDAERTALRLESHKIADKQRSRIVGQIDTDRMQTNNENSRESSSSLKSLQNSINVLSDQVKDLKMHNRQNEGQRKFANGRFQNNPNSVKNERMSRQRQNNHPTSNRFQARSASKNRNNFQRNAYTNGHSQNLRADADAFIPRGRQNSERQNANYNQRNGSTLYQNNQGNWNQSVWGAANRRH